MRKQHLIRHPGFTLVEILVVVVILGIAGAIVVPQLGTRDDRTSEAAARVMMADLIYAQNLAITQQSNLYVMFQLTPTPSQYSLVRSSDMTVVSHPVNKTPYTVVFGTGGSSGMQGITLVSADFKGQSATTYQTIGFDEIGMPVVLYNGATSQALTSGSIVIQAGQFKLRIDIEPFTGQITVTAI
jgi:type II secretion system protein H